MEEQLYLRPATRDDLKLLFDWVNEPAVRQNSFNTSAISITEHSDWLESVLDDRDTKLFIIQEDAIPIGQVRLVHDTNVWHISYSIALPYRAQGYGKIILQLAENELIRGGHVGENLYAEVKADNIASRRIFRKLGYSEVAGQHDNAHGYIKDVSLELCEINTPMSIKGGHILLLSNNVNSLPLLNWLEKRVDVLYYSDRVNVAMMERINPHLVVSYNYRHIITPDIIETVHGNIINMHISLLPWNRGSSPNIWSFIDDTPKGVTIHVLDEGLDTGDILLQKEIFFDEETETLKSSYERLNTEIVKLLQDHWSYIYGMKWCPHKQGPSGSVHTLKDLRRFIHGRTLSYDMTITQFKRKFEIEG